MSGKNAAWVQHAPLRTPSGWGEEEQRFVRQLSAILEDIYRRYGRLGEEDLSAAFRESLEAVRGRTAEANTAAEEAQTRAESAREAAEITGARQSELANRVARLEGAEGNYEALLNKPRVNGTSLTGNRSSAELGLSAAAHTHAPEEVDGLQAALTKLSGVEAGAEVNPSALSELTDDLGSNPTHTHSSYPLMSAVQAVLQAGSWEEHRQTAAVNGVTAAANVIVSPGSGSAEEYASAGLLCTAQGEGSLTFSCNEDPANDVNVNILILWKQGE